MNRQAAGERFRRTVLGCSSTKKKGTQSQDRETDRTDTQFRGGGAAMPAPEAGLGRREGKTEKAER